MIHFKAPLHNRFAEGLRRHSVALLLVDCQKGLLDPAALGRPTLVNNIVGLATLARAFAIPIVIGMRNRVHFGPLLSELGPYEAHGRVIQRDLENFWEDRRSRSAVRGYKRRHLVVAGITARQGMMTLAVDARRDGYDVHIVADASAGGTEGEDRSDFEKFASVDIQITGWVAVIAALASSVGDSLSTESTLALNRYLASYGSRPIGWGYESLGLPYNDRTIN